MEFDLAWPRPPAPPSADMGSVAGLAAILRRAVAASLEAQRSHWMLWLPVALAAGAAVYFALPVEPHGLLALLAAGLALVLAVQIRRGKRGPPVILIAACAAGFVAAKARTLALDTVLLPAPTGAVMLTGRIVGLEPLGARSLRVRLAAVHLDGIVAPATPRRVEIRMARSAPPLARGATIAVEIVLYPPSGPVLPDGYDHARTLWFDGIGATGRAIGPARVLARPAGFVPADWIDGWRDAIGARIRAALPAPIGAFAEAQIIGERGHLPRDVTEALQLSGLAHILSISGLHMALVAGGVFLLLRALLALSPQLAMTRPVRTWAALGALLATAVYLALSGGGVATWRAAIMIAMLFAAMLAERPALSLHNLVAAATLLILLAPESVLSASFQMSFLAVMGLIAAHEAAARWQAGRDGEPVGMRHWIWTILRWLGRAALAMLATTLVASLCSGLPAVYHFNRLSAYGLLANGLALPVISVVVMPAALVAMIAMPFGLETLPLRLMGAGLEAVLAIARIIADLPGAHAAIAAPPPSAMLLMTAGLIFLCLWQGPGRLIGLLVIAGGLALAGTGQKPDILVERLGTTVAIRSENGVLALPMQRKARFTVEKWLLREGDSASFADALRRPGWQCGSTACRALVKGRRLVYLRQDTARNRVAQLCGNAEIVIAAVPLRGACRAARLRIDRFDLWRNGAYAAYSDGAGDWRVVTARDLQGRRPWVAQPAPRASIRSDGGRPRAVGGSRP